MSALLQPLLSFPVWAVRWSLSAGSRSGGALTLLRHHKPISTLEFTAEAVGEQPVFRERGKKNHSAFPSQSPQRKCSMKLSTIPLLLFSSSLPVGWMSPGKGPLPSGILLQIHGENTKQLWSADRTQQVLTFYWEHRLKVQKSRVLTMGLDSEMYF